MRYFLLLTLFTCLLTRSFTRPSRMEARNNGEAEENEYESSDNVQAEDSAQDEDDARLNDQDSMDASREVEAPKPQHFANLEKDKSLRRPFMDRQDKISNDNFPEYTKSRTREDKLEDTAPSNHDYASLPQRRQSNGYAESSDISDLAPSDQHLPDYKSNHLQGDNSMDKRTIESHVPTIEDSDTVFDNQREHRKTGDKSEYNNDIVDSSEQSRHFKQYYNTMQSEHKSMLGDRNYDRIARYNINRDRRQAEQSETYNLSSTSTEKETVLNAEVNEDDEAAIKRHIKKLSGDELEELLNSLSDDKKALLNKIMENNLNDFESLNKREITKKAGAVEENNFIDSSLSDLSKVQEGSPSIDANSDSSSSQSVDTSIKQETPSDNDSINSKPDTTRAETENKNELAGSLDNGNTNMKMEDGLNTVSKNLLSPNTQPVKTESKREINIDSMRNFDESLDDMRSSDNYLNMKDSNTNEQSSGCSSQDDDLSQFIDDDDQFQNNKDFKREAFLENQSEFDDSFKSLEESFPISNCEESGQYFESNMVPLVRVKRKGDLVIKKRAAGLVPDTKVAYFPYKAENDDEDNDEGSEFDDDGFYDRTSNLKNEANKVDDNIKYAAHAQSSKLIKTQSNIEGQPKLSDSPLNDKESSNTMSLGSDTDSVLSGIEGVNDNLMYNSGTRNRRTTSDENVERVTEEQPKRPFRCNALSKNNLNSPENYMNIPNYQENDAFGALPRNYEGELSRYKRIRRVKQSPASEVTMSDNN